MRHSSHSSPYSKKSLGQNFLTDPVYVDKIIQAVDPVAGDTVVEIGPGRGALTECLVESGANVIAIELDRYLARELAERFARSSRFHVIEGNVLDLDLGSIASWPPAHGTPHTGGSEYNPPDDASDPDLKLVANLPYYISTAILQRLAGQRIIFKELVLMFQKEVADRIIAGPGNSERGYLTVIAEAAFQIEILFDVPPTAFSPRPKVWSSVVRLIPKPKCDLDDERFLKLLRTAFVQKRKTLLNNLKVEYPYAAEAIKPAGVDPKCRAETLSLAEWSAVYELLVQRKT